MRIIGKIRNNTWLLIVMLGLGMLAFLLMDMFQQNSIFTSGGAEVGTVNGKGISQKEFSRKEQAFFANSGGNIHQKRESLWNYMVQETLVEQESEALGISVPKQELRELFISPDPRFRSPVVTNEFGGQQGSFDVANVEKILNEINNYPIQQKKAWKSLEDRVYLDHKTNKLNTLVAKSMYTPTWLAEEEFKTSSQNVGMKVVSVPFSAIEEEITIGDEEIKKYMASNAFKYTNEEETRDIEYVIVNVVPTASDSAEIKGVLETEMAKFATTDNDSTFVKNNYGIWDDGYFSESQINPNIAFEAMSSPVGTQIGPFVEGAVYKSAKIIDRKVVADSVEARHIFVPAQNNPTYSPNEARRFLDSIRTVINSGGVSFETLMAAQNPKYFGQDFGVVSNGSNLGKDLKDQIMYYLPKGKLSIINTQFGTHLIDIVRTVSSGTTGVKLAYLSKSIIPSDDTRRKAIDVADELIAKNRTLEALKKAAAGNSALTLGSASGLTSTAYTVSNLTGGDEAARNIVKWAYKSSVGKVSPDVYSFDRTAGEDSYTDRLVLVGLSKIASPGLASVNQYRDEITAILSNQKRGEMLSAALKGKSMDEVATQYNSSISDINASLARPLINQSNEEKVVAAAMSMSPNTTSAPIVGNNGVYVVEVTSAPAPVDPSTANIPSLRKSISSQATSGISSALFEAMKKTADISDNRGTIY